MDNREIAIQLSGVKKRYKLGQIGGGTLQGDLQSWWARARGKEDPNSQIGTDQRLIGQTFYALNGIDLTIYKGEALGIIGSNGAGKSTLLKLLSRVTAPTEGEIDIYGRIASMLEVGTGFHGEMTGRENIYMNGAILGMTKTEIDAKMEDIIEFSEVREFIDTPVKRYSSGMYVKLAFSVAAHLDSEIMIMDEVLAVGDMAFQKKCLGKMGDAAEHEGRTVLYVSHNMQTIRQLCTRCVVLSHGQIIFDGDVEKAIEIYMNNHAKDMGTDIDLSSSRMDHLSPIVVAKIINVKLLGKDAAQYEVGESIPLSVSIRAKQSVSSPCFRIEIRKADDTPVGASYVHRMVPLSENAESTYNCVFDCSNLVPGRYKALLVLYEVNEFGTYNDLDAVWPGFVFEVIDTERKIEINWNHSHWGSVNFGRLMEKNDP